MRRLGFSVLVTLGLAATAHAAPKDLALVRPDCVVFRPTQPADPKLADPTKTGDGYNDHFQVIWDETRKLYYAFWTQASREGDADMHVCFSKSADRGRTWSAPKVLAGSERRCAPKPRAVWQQPMLAKTGRLYCLWNQQASEEALHHGLVYGRYSDDGGETWTEPEENKSIPRQPRDDPKGVQLPNWCNWQRPIRVGADGRFMTGCTRHVKPADVVTSPGRTVGSWVEFWQYENIDENPEIRDIRITVLNGGEKSLSIPIPGTDRFCCEEASLVKLPDGRLFALVRSRARHPFWSVSKDGGRNWTKPVPLKDRAGKPYLHPNSPCPMYDLEGCAAASGECFALIHNAYDDSIPPLGRQVRGPLYRIRGHFDPTGEQPFAFDSPELFIPLESGNSCYASYTVADGERMLWFGLRKHELVGKSLDPAPAAQPAAPVDYGIRSKSWTLTADGEALLAEWAKRPYRRLNDHTAIFVRAQLKYGINRTDFLHAWYDRPLLQDSSLEGWQDVEGETRAWLNPDGWKKSVEMARLGKQDGFAVFTNTKNRDEVIPLSVKPGSETTILVEFTNGMKKEDCLRRAEEALGMPNSFRLGGKVVLTSYPANDESRLPFYADLKRTLTERFGDRFLLMPYIGVLGTKGTIAAYDAKTLTALKDRLVRFLRVLDGICYNSRESYFNLRYDPWLFDHVLAPTMHAALTEPEFAGRKYLGCWATPGHENAYRWNKGLDSTGTRMLRDTFDSIGRLRPDFVVGCEWDEENENTHFRPTVANGFTHQRLLRYYADTFAGRAPDLFPGDRTDVPNLVLCHRKDLMAGEMLEAEVLNIPDGTFRGETLTVRFRWLDAQGGVLHAFEPRTLKADELKAAWFNVPVSSLVAKSPVAYPELTVWTKVGRHVFADGFWSAGLHASRTIEQKWVKEPVRDLPHGTKGSLSVDGPDADGFYTVSGQVTSERKLRSVAVIDGVDTVYMAGGADHQPGMETVRIAFQGFATNGKKGIVRGRISVVDGEGAKLSVGRTRGHVDVEGSSFVFTGAMGNHWVHTLFVDVPSEKAAAAKLAFDLEPFGKGEVKLSELKRKEVIAYPVAKGLALVFTSYRSARAIPVPQMTNDATFSIKVKPDTPRSVFRLETIDEDYHVYRAKAVSIAKATGRTVTYHVYEDMLDRVSEVTLDTGSVPSVAYDFGPSRGGVVATDAGRGLWGILGSYASLVTGYGQAESGGAMVVARTSVKAGTPELDNSAPERLGGGVLRFKRGGFVSFGQQIVPTEAGFELELDVKPVDVKRRQGLLTTGPTAFNLFIEDGKVKASFFLRNRFMRLSGREASVTAVGPELKPGEWNAVRLVYDQRTCRLDVNGVRGESVPCTGTLFYPHTTALGAGSKHAEFFEGELRNFSVSLR